MNFLKKAKKEFYNTVYNGLGSLKYTSLRRKLTFLLRLKRNGSHLRDIEREEQLPKNLIED